MQEEEGKESEKNSKIKIKEIETKTNKRHGLFEYKTLRKRKKQSKINLLTAEIGEMKEFFFIGTNISCMIKF